MFRKDKGRVYCISILIIPKASPQDFSYVSGIPKKQSIRFHWQSNLSLNKIIEINIITFQLFYKAKVTVNVSSYEANIT